MSISPPTPQMAVQFVPLQTLTIGGRWRTEAMRSYRMPILLWFTRGQGRITVAGTTRGYGPHNAILIPARVMHGFQVTAQVFGTAMFFDPDSALPLPTEPRHLRIRDGMAQAEMNHLIDQIQRELDGARPARARAIHHLAGLLTVWLDRNDASAELSANTAAHDLARRFTDAVERQLYTGQSLADYAEALGVTATHLSRVCTETCGRPASEILADRVIYEARRLLADTAMPIKQVSEILGFATPSYFSRAFQSRTGLSPTEFRDQTESRVA